MLQTVQIPWISLGAINATTADADDALAVSERLYGTIKALTNVLSYKVPAGINTLLSRFILGTDNHDVDIDVWLGKLNEDGEAGLIRVATLDVIAGTQIAEDGVSLYADTINVSNDNWLFGVKTAIPAAEHMGILAIDMAGFDLVVFHGYGTFDSACTVEISGF